MTSEIEILLVTKEQATTKTVESVLTESKDFALADVCQDLSQARSYLSHKKAQAVVVDIDPDPPGILSNLGTFFEASPNVFVVVVSRSLTKKLALQAMKAGARHFLEKKKLACELTEGLQSLICDDKKRETKSDSAVVPVFSAGGGCGATTVAVNLASELRLLSPKRVLAIDLDSCYGTISTYLGIKSRYGIVDVLTPRKNVIDEHLIRSSAYTYKEDFHVLTSPASAESPGPRSLQYENLPRALEACRKVYGYTVIDAPRLPKADIIDLARMSDIVVVVFQLTVKDVNSTRFMVSSLAKAGIARWRIIPLANRVKRRGPLITFEEIRKALGLYACRAVRSDWRSAMKSVNSAQPLAETVGRSGLRKDVQKLAVKVHACKDNGNGKI
jgi:pilus assembly protein CpaE